MRLIAGIDEVGRGAWAGPLVAAAVVLGCKIQGLDDSKKLNAKNRKRLAVEIHENAHSVGIGWVEPQEIDKLGLTHAVTLAMYRAVTLIGYNFTEIVIDGNYNFFSNLNDIGCHEISTIVGADGTVPEVSAASIVAKVARDTYMAEQDEHYPSYNFAKNVGYGTHEHALALDLYGITPLHRKSFKPVQVKL